MAKVLVSGLSNSGKTSLLQSLTDVFVFANDGKKYPFAQPHRNVGMTNTADDIISELEDALAAYETKMGSMPSTIVFDSISKMLLDIEGHYLNTVASFPYGPIGKDVVKLMNYIEIDLVQNGCNVVFVSHAVKDGDGAYSLVTAGGSSGKRGGVIADVDNAVYLEVKGKKRIVHTKNPKLLARSLDEDMPEFIALEDFNLQEYLENIIAKETDTDDWAI